MKYYLGDRIWQLSPIYNNHSHMCIFIYNN